MNNGEEDRVYFKRYTRGILYQFTVRETSQPTSVCVLMPPSSNADTLEHAEIIATTLPSSERVRVNGGQVKKKGNNTRPKKSIQSQIEPTREKESEPPKRLCRGGVDPEKKEIKMKET